MKYGAGAVDSHVSDACAWNPTADRDRHAITTDARDKLAGSLDRFQLLRPWLLSRVSLAAVATAAVALDAGLSRALAQCAGPASNTICTPGGNPYAAGIDVNTEDGLGGTPINLTLQSGVNVVIPAGAGGVNAVNTHNTGGVTAGSANSTITAVGATINNTANSGTANNTGLRIQSSGDAAIAATNTTISVSGTTSTWGILAFAMPNLTGLPHDASVIWNGPQLTTSGGVESGAVQADNRGIGNATVVASGNITVVPSAGVGTTQYGLLAHSGDSLLAPSGAGNASVTFNSGTLDVSAVRPRGILAWVDGNGSASVTTAPNTVINVSGTQFGGPGVYVFSSTASATLTADVASQITSVGPATTNLSNLPVGIRANNSGTSAPIFVTYSGPGITTQGGNGHGIFATSGSGTIDIRSTGPITTNGSGASGILAQSRTGTVDVTSSGAISTNGITAFGIRTDSGTLPTRFSSDPGDDAGPVVAPSGIGSAVTVNATAPITTVGQEAQGIWASSATGPTAINVAQVMTTGQFSSAVRATGAAVAINVAAGGSVMGGWQSGVTDVGPNLGLPSSGVSLSATGLAVLTNNGTIGALSDRAVFGDPTIINNGTMIGFVQLTGINDYFNNGAFNFRHFADTNGDGIRDTLRVAVSDLGSGPSTFTNNGTLALLGGPGATTLDATGQYLPLGLTFNAMALGGPVQGQILGATTFTNSGTIDLQANPVPGDVLLISGGHTPGMTGGGTFVASGGRLLLDTVLNGGGAASRSDVLVVDGTAVGPGGATRLFARNAGGAGALTVDNGILVVQSVDPGRSVSGVFTLGAPAVAGPYEYTLFLGGVGANATNGNWYLRSTLNCALSPTLPQCQAPIPPTPTPTPTPTPPNVPNFRAETSLYAAIPSMALLYGRNLLDTLHERVGEEFDERGTLAAAPGGYYKTAPLNPASQYLGWGRVIGMNGVQHGDSLGVLGGSGGPRFDYSFLGLQAGMNFYRQERPDGSRDHAGAYFAIGTSQGQVTHFDGREGNSNFNAYSLGGYWTHFGATGWYTDAILQGTFYDISSTANRGLPAFKTDAQGFAASLETGYPFRFAGGWFIEPQAQLIYQNININDASDIAAQIRFADVDSLLGRIGARFGRTWALDDGLRTITAWMRPSLWNEFRSNPITSFSSETGFIPFHADLGGLWGEINAGVSGKVNPNTTLYANASYQSRFDGGGFAYTGKAGLRVTW